MTSKFKLIRTNVQPTLLPADGSQSQVMLALEGCKGSIEATLAWRPVIKDEKALFDHVSHLLRGDDMSPLHSEGKDAQLSIRFRHSLSHHYIGRIILICIISIQYNLFYTN